MLFYPSTELFCLSSTSTVLAWVVAGATAAFDWSLMVPVRPPNSM